MTDEQFNALAPFEGIFERALKNKPRYSDYPGRAAMETMVAVIKTALPHYRSNLNCRTCVFNTIKDAGRMYFGEKEIREQAALKAAEKAAMEEALKVSGSSEEKPKKKTTRKKKAE